MTICFKVCGVVLVVFATSAYGFMMSGDLQKRLSQLYELKKIMFLLKGEISYGATPLLEACSNIAKRVKAPFCEVLYNISVSEEKTIKEIWKTNFSDGFKYMNLNGEDKERLLLLGDSLGLSDKETQSRVISLYLEELEMSIKALNEMLPKKTRVYRCLGVVSGIMLAIIII